MKFTREDFRTLLEAVIIPVIIFAVYILNDLNKSVGVLNTQVGIILNNNVNLEKRVERLEDKVFP